VKAEVVTSGLQALQRKSFLWDITISRSHSSPQSVERSRFPDCNLAGKFTHINLQ